MLREAFTISDSQYKTSKQRYPLHNGNVAQYAFTVTCFMIQSYLHFYIVSQ